MNLPEWVNLTISIFALLVAFSALFWNIYRERSRLKISADYFGYGPEDNRVYKIEFLVYNTSNKKISITSITLYYDYKKRSLILGHVLFDIGYPIELNPGECWQYTFDADKLQNLSSDDYIDYIVFEDGSKKTYKKSLNVHI
jgi:hypothetical protein